MRYANAVASAEGKQAAVTALIALQRRVAEPLPGVMLELFKLRGQALLDAEVHDHLEALRRRQEFDLLDSAWRAIAQARCPEKKISQQIRDIDPILIEVYFSIFSREARVSDLKGLANQDWRHDGIFLAWLEGPLKQLTSVSDGVDNSRRSLFKHQDMILETGWLSYDGRDGRISAVDSCLFYDRIFYTFVDEEVWCAISGLESGAFCGVFIPRANLIVRTSWAGSRVIHAATAASISALLLSRVCASVIADENPFSREPAPDTERSVVACIGGVENFAHQAMNSFSGIDRAIGQGMLRKIRRVAFFGSEFFGEIGNLFPELSDLEIVRRRNRGVGFSPPFSRSEILCNIGDQFVSRSLQKRIMDNASGAALFSRKLTGIVSEIGARSRAIYVAVRSGDKSLVDQEREMIELVKAVEARFPGSLWIFDAFSVPTGSDYISQSWKKFIGETDLAIKAIVDGCFEIGASAVSISGFSLNEAICVMQGIDVYVAPIGTAQHKVGWFSKAPGVVYASEKWAEVAPEKLPGLKIVQGAALPEMIFGGAEKEPPLIRSLHDNRMNLERVRLSGKDVAEKVIRILSAVEGRRPENAGSAA